MTRYSTPEAQALKEAIERYGVPVSSEKSDGFKHIDLAIPAAKINIEVDGRQHYLDPEQIVRDFGRSYYSDIKGFNTIHIPNQIVHENLERVAWAIAEVAKSRMR